MSSEKRKSYLLKLDDLKCVACFCCEEILPGLFRQFNEEGEFLISERSYNMNVLQIDAVVSGCRENALKLVER